MVYIDKEREQLVNVGPSDASFSRALGSLERRGLIKKSRRGFYGHRVIKIPKLLNGRINSFHVGEGPALAMAEGMNVSKR
jgi:uncharacterized membrane protein